MTLKPNPALALLCAFALTGCISLLPKQKPVPLYTFGAPPPASTAAEAVKSGRVAVRLAPIGFAVPSASDRILTVEGNRASYIAGGRWLAPAATLFEGAVVQTFDSRPGPVRLAARGEIAPVAYILKLDVRRFEARYDNGAGAAPVIVIEVYAALDGTGPQMANRAKLFTVRVSAGDNRIGPIANAFDQAVGQVLAQVVDWANTGSA